MDKDAFIFEVGQKSFDQYILLNSHKIPVVAQFLGVWSEPCIVVTEIFSSLAKEFPQQFIFAKVDIDEQEELRKQYNIQEVPTTIVFKDGKIARTETGPLDPEQARALLKDFGIFHEADLLREQAREKHMSGDTPGAILLLTEAIKKDPGDTLTALYMVQIFLDIRQLDQAIGLFNRLPESARQSDMGKSISGQLTFIELAAKTAGKDELVKKLADDEHDHDARFDLSVCLISEYEYSAAAEELFTILADSPDYKDGAARELVITISHLLEKTQNEAAQEIRRKLSNMLSA